MRRQLRKRPILVSALATAIAAIAVLVIARVTGADAVGRAFDNLHPEWIPVIAAAELLAYPAYAIAYRSLAQVHGHEPMAVALLARVVVAGFGPFAIGGGFGIDKRTLEAVNEDERSAQVRVVALGTLEWAVLAPVTSVVAIVLLVQHANIMASLLWPWALAVPLGFGVGLWVSSQKRRQRFSTIRGRRREWLAHLLDGVGVLHTLIREPRAYLGAWLGTALYWAADITALYAGLRTFGLDPSTGKVIIAYATGYAATRRSLPLGGAGITEVMMIYALYWVRLPLAPALGAVVAYRAFNFLVAALPALIANHQLERVLATASARRLRLARREPRGDGGDGGDAPPRPRPAEGR